MFSTKRLLQTLCAGVLLLVAENAVLIAEMWYSNRNLRAIQYQLGIMQDDMQHVRQDVEANAEALEYLTSMLEEQQGTR